MTKDSFGTMFYLSNELETSAWDRPLTPLHPGYRVDTHVRRSGEGPLARDPMRLHFATDVKCVLSDMQLFRGAVTVNGDSPARKYIKTTHVWDD